MTLRRRTSLLFGALLLVTTTATPAFAANETPPTTLPAQPQNTSAVGVTTQSASCTGCNAAWGLWEDGNTIRALRGSYTGEFVSFIHAHYAFIKPDPDSCADMYDGPYADFGNVEDTNTSQDQVKDSDYGQGGQHHWTNAGAHQWTDDGINYFAGSNGETDICKDFGF